MTAELVVTVVGAALIAWVLWYFFVAGRRGASARAEQGDGVQRVRIEVRGGYTPSEVHVTAGRPVRLEFARNETNPCTDEVVLPAFGIRTWLAPHETTTVEFTPATPGTYDFSCGMGMVHGRLVVEAAP